MDLHVVRRCRLAGNCRPEAADTVGRPPRTRLPQHRTRSGSEALSPTPSPVAVDLLASALYLDHALAYWVLGRQDVWEPPNMLVPIG